MSQVAHWKGIFDVIDQDHDGKITEEDIKNTYSSLGLKDEGEAAKMMAEADSDGLVFNGFLKLMGTKYGDFSDRNELEQVFAAFQDDSKTVNAAELKEHLISVGKSNQDIQLSKDDINNVLRTFGKKSDLTGKTAFAADKFIDTVSR
ncbi:hypothetical protein KL933_003722 [Ogataea haglerorum]|uniref:EF-hand domain-containing protein n=1 Tax=Ogataea haglerorum TaxID=1937702 RepID=A0AAN6D4V9_9ASCO|nr:hypothetical protein KL915_003424 [Ogataea haglerorum]KAG7705207.1 hypothetical protein KL914_003893 [Ogataea haglerorum]KAG7705464.1 hypothetical protein KL950_003900 [Ogataea haglerorum]KAG7716666.1 hypothetical protein KL913_003182 [Ogataea haglerorum]KAG7717581.1 hypothetical protein KL949_003415 [Ogataea haglerorum]